jgi:hypothetical protein
VKPCRLLGRVPDALQAAGCRAIARRRAAFFFLLFDRANYQDHEKFSLNSRSISYRYEPETTQANKNKTANDSQLRLQPA